MVKEWRIIDIVGRRNFSVLAGLE